MERLQFIRPRLIEPGVKYFINTTLEQCQMLKVKYYNFLYNLGLLVLFAGILSIFLYYKYKQKNDRLAQQEQKRQQQEYIINKLRFMQDYRKNQVNNLVTDLPTWQNNPEVQFYNRKIFS